MTEMYPVRAPGDYAGSFCAVEKPRRCKNYARFLVSEFNNHGPKLTACGQHLSPIVKGVQALSGKAAVVQEIPGMRNSETVFVDGELRTLAPADRKAMVR